MLTRKIIAERHRYCFVACLALLVVANADAQTLEHVQEFWDFTGDVQFFPGGYVSGNPYGGDGLYVYRNSKFEPLKGEIPPLLKGWSSFDWVVDYLDQVDRSETLAADLRALLPRRTKVKKVHKIFLPGDKNELALICFTRRLQIAGPDAADIFVTAALNPNPNDNRSEYHKLWSRRLTHNSSYGDFQYQVIPGAGKFILLYSSVTGGDAVEHHLDVYRLRGIEGVKTPSKSRSISPKSLPHSAQSARPAAPK